MNPAAFLGGKPPLELGQFPKVIFRVVLHVPGNYIQWLLESSGEVFSYVVKTNG